MLLENSLRKSILEIDAFFKNGITGTIIIENEIVYLETKNEMIELNDSFKIEIYNNRKYYEVHYDDLLKTKCDFGFPAYAGYSAIVVRGE